MSSKAPNERFLKRHILPSDSHGFIGRVYDLSIVFYNFDKYDDLSRHADIRYVFEVDQSIGALVRRVDSLNIVGKMLWPKPFPDPAAFPISFYEWLTISADTFLMRFVSVIDCSLQLVNTIYEISLPPADCKIKQLKRAGVPAAVIDHLEGMLSEQTLLRAERNARVHEGIEREFTSDDMMFRMAVLLDLGCGIDGVDQNGRRINLRSSFREGLVGLQRQFNRSTRKLVHQMDALYDDLWQKFEDRFSLNLKLSNHGLGVGPRQGGKP